MSNFMYEAVDAAGQSSQGTLSVGSQNEALKRIRDMGLFPTKLAEHRESRSARPPASTDPRRLLPSVRAFSLPLPLFRGRVKPVALAVFTRQLAILIDAGMPLLRGLRILHAQQSGGALKLVISEIAGDIEQGRTLTEALSAHPRVFDRLYVNMVRAGEISGTLEVTLLRLAEFVEKALKIKRKVKAAMFYPAAVMLVAGGILTLMMVFIVPRFQAVFDGLMGGAPMPAFTSFIIRVSEVARHHAPMVGLGLVVCAFVVWLALQTQAGRFLWDKFKITVPVVGPVFLKSAISRLTRTLGTLLGSGVPILQAFTIVRETAGNLVVARLVERVHESVKQGETITAPLRQSNVIAPIYVGMIDVGEQTGAMPGMLMKIADQCDDDVDNAVTAMTSLLEPILIIFLAVVVGSIVIAMFLPIIGMIGSDNIGGGESGEI
jgi:type IV pilus assembly protein PilC